MMSIVEYFDYPDRTQEKEHFMDLILIALADGIIDDTEMKMLVRLGKNMGLTDPEIDDLLESSKNWAYIPPYDLIRRFEQLYDIVEMVLADGKMETKKMRLAGMLALKSGFAVNEIPALLDLLIRGIKNREAEEDLFNLYKNSIMTLK